MLAALWGVVVMVMMMIMMMGVEHLTHVDVDLTKINTGEVTYPQLKWPRLNWLLYELITRWPSLCFPDEKMQHSATSQNSSAETEAHLRD